MRQFCSHPPPQAVTVVRYNGKWMKYTPKARHARSALNKEAMHNAVNAISRNASVRPRFYPRSKNPLDNRNDTISLRFTLTYNNYKWPTYATSFRESNANSSSPSRAERDLRSRHGGSKLSKKFRGLRDKPDFDFRMHRRNEISDRDVSIQYYCCVIWGMCAQHLQDILLISERPFNDRFFDQCGIDFSFTQISRHQWLPSCT